MDFEYSDKVKELMARVSAFMDEYVYPAEAEMHEQVAQNQWTTPALMEELKAKAKAQGLWNLFLPVSYGKYSAGLTNYGQSILGA